MKRIVILFFLLLVSNIIIAETEKYPVRDIPKPLLSRSCVVVRDYSVSFKLISKGEGKKIIHIAKTILDKRGDSFANISLPYNKQRDLDINYIKYYNANGRLIKKVKNREIDDFSNNAGYVLLGDIRIKRFDYTPTTYPYTVEYEFEYELEGLLSYINWFPIVSSKIALQKASLRVDLPKNIKARYYKENVDKKIKITEIDDRRIYTLDLHDIKSMKYEPYVDDNEILPYVEFAPKDFIYDGYDGNMSTWKNYGLWINKLTEGRQELDEQTKIDVDKLIKDISDKREKIKVLYKYLQSKTRYVCISLGIGGFQPMKASDVGKTGYGDCKALSNFMVSILKYAGIKANYCEIGVSGSKITKPSFSNVAQTNHAIACVPMKNDTIWLENTSQRLPFNFIGSNNSNRKALMIEDGGAKIVNTHSYSYKDNINKVNSFIEISKDGLIKYDIKDWASGLLVSSFLRKLNESEEELKKYHKRIISDGSVKIYSIDYKLLEEGKNPKVVNRLKYSIKDSRITTDKTISLEMPEYNKVNLRVKRCRHRKYDAIIETAYTHIDTIRIKLPSNYTFFNRDSVLKIDNKYFKYSDKYSIKKGRIIYTREYIRKKVRVLPKEYKAYYKLYKKIYRRQKLKLRFLNISSNIKKVLESKLPK